MHEAAQTATGIPIEWLFGSLAALVAVLYLDLKASTRALLKDASKRTIRLVKMDGLLRQLARKADIVVPWENSDDE